MMCFMATAIGASPLKLKPRGHVVNQKRVSDDIASDTIAQASAELEKNPLISSSRRADIAADEECTGGQCDAQAVGAISAIRLSTSQCVLGTRWDRHWRRQVQQALGREWPAGSAQAATPTYRDQPAASICTGQAEFGLELRSCIRRLRQRTAGQVFEVVDEYTRESLAIDVAGLIRSARVSEVLSILISMRGAPCYLRSDNEPEFVSWALPRHGMVSQSRRSQGRHRRLAPALQFGTDQPEVSMPTELRV